MDSSALVKLKKTKKLQWIYLCSRSRSSQGTARARSSPRVAFCFSRPGVFQPMDRRGWDGSCHAKVKFFSIARDRKNRATSITPIPCVKVIKYKNEKLPLFWHLLNGISAFQSIIAGQVRPPRLMPRRPGLAWPGLRKSAHVVFYVENPT